MKKQRLISALILILLSSTCFSMSKSETAIQSIGGDLKLLETWVKAQQGYRNIPGITIGLVYDQELVYSKSFGFSDLEKKTLLTVQDPFRMASITKTFTATALVQLRDAGKLRLDDPVKMYLPWFNISQRFPGEPAITIRHLLTHTSGLPREADFPYWTDHKFPTMEQIKETLSTQETIYPPSTEIKYSNLGLSLAGEIVAVVSGVTYEEYVQTHILEPLKMDASSVIPDPSYQQLLVTPYSHRQAGGDHEVEEYTDTKGIAAAASLASTVTDLASYVSLQFREDDNSSTAVLKIVAHPSEYKVFFLKESLHSLKEKNPAIFYRAGKRKSTRKM